MGQFPWDELPVYHWKVTITISVEEFDLWSRHEILGQHCATLSAPQGLCQVRFKQFESVAIEGNYYIIEVRAAGLRRTDVERWKALKNLQHLNQIEQRIRDAHPAKRIAKARFHTAQRRRRGGQRVEEYVNPNVAVNCSLGGAAPPWNWTWADQFTSFSDMEFTPSYFLGHDFFARRRHSQESS